MTWPAAFWEWLTKPIKDLLYGPGNRYLDYGQFWTSVGLVIVCYMALGHYARTGEAQLVEFGAAFVAIAGLMTMFNTARGYFRKTDMGDE